MKDSLTIDQALRIIDGQVEEDNDDVNEVDDNVDILKS